VPELRIDVSNLKSESSNLIKELAVFLEEKVAVKVETTANEIIVKGEEAISIKSLRALLKDFLQKVNVKGKVKKGKGKNLVIAKSKGKPIFCGSGGEWKVELEQRLKKDDEIVLLALGDVKYEVLAYLNRRKDIEILKLETRQMKKREKGTGLKATVRKSPN
jgi:molybdopterin converting factor small subunit